VPKQLVIRVQSDGSVRVDTVGMSGEACLEYAEIAEDVCGAAIAEQALTPNYYAAAQEESAREATDELA
jgi:hypothetical protein